MKSSLNCIPNSRVGRLVPNAHVLYELYIPSEMAIGGSGIDDDKVPANTAVIFTLELVEIKGKTKSALKCDPRNPTRYCNEMERDFIQEM
jgi:hypothetical protein